MQVYMHQALFSLEFQLDFNIWAVGTNMAQFTIIGKFFLGLSFNLNLKTTWSKKLNSPWFYSCMHNSFVSLGLPLTFVLLWQPTLPFLLAISEQLWLFVGTLIITINLQQWKKAHNDYNPIFQYNISPRNPLLVFGSVLEILCSGVCGYWAFISI